MGSPWPGWILSDSFVSLRNRRGKIKRKQTKTNANFVLGVFNFLSFKMSNKGVRGSGFLVAVPAGLVPWLGVL